MDSRDLHEALAANAGSLDILNVGAGHLQVSFAKDDPVEVERAKRMVVDMLRRGYAIFVEGKGGRLHRVRSFDANLGLYYITDVPALGEGEHEGEPVDRPTSPEPVATEHHATSRDAAPSPPPIMNRCPRCGAKRHQGRCKQRAVPMVKAKATAVGRTAGG